MNEGLIGLIIIIAIITFIVCLYGIVINAIENKKIEKIINYFKEKSAKKEANEKIKECLKIIKENQERKNKNE